MVEVFFGQRWTFQIGNSLIKIDNAYSSSGWGQERLIINDEQVRATEGMNRSKQDYFEPWLTTVGETELVVQLKSGLFSIHCSAFIDGTEVEFDKQYLAEWSGENGAWPPEAVWKERGQPPKEPKFVKYFRNLTHSFHKKK